MFIKIVTTVFILVLFNTSSAQSNADTIFQMQKSPWGAVLRSAILPGFGQYYNESYWKIPIVWGVLTWFTYNYTILNNDYKFYRDRYISTANPNDKTLRDDFRDERDMFAIYLGLTYLANLLDAYVDAHMFDFTVKESSSLSPGYFCEISLKIAL